MRQVVRALLIGGGVVALILVIGYFSQMTWAIATWPWPDSRLSYIFVASIQAAIGTAMIWIGASGEFGALAAGALNLVVMMGGASAFLLIHSMQPNQAHVLAYAIGCGVFAVANLLLFLWMHRVPQPNLQPIPRVVRLSFAVFTIILVLVGVALIRKAPNIMPWVLKPETSVIVGLIFFGDAFYFLYAVLRPYWVYARAQLWSFLAYDLVLIAPLLAHFAVVKPELLPSLVVYIAVLIMSSAVASYYLFVNKTTRVWLSAKLLDGRLS
jgi:hypothetical protein